ncbi:MAG: hypothetical protein V3U98_10270 [Acidobacteriota bacterium]
MVRLTLTYFVVQITLLSAGFIFRQDWVFPLLAVVNLIAGPVALLLFVIRPRGPREHR